MSALLNPFIFGSAPPEPPARYWRLRFPNGSTSDTFVECYDLKLRSAVGGARQDTSGGGSASSASLSAANAFDATINTGSPWKTTSGAAVNSWLANDLGSNKDIAEFEYRIFTEADAPTDIVVEYSNDAATWYADARWPTLSGLAWEAEEYKIIPRADQGTPLWRGSKQFPGEADSGGWTNYTQRMSVTASRLFGTGNRIRFGLRSGTTEGATLNKAYVGVRGTGALDFAAAPTQVLFGGNAGITVGVNTDILSDPVTLTVGASDDIIIAVYTSSGASSADQWRRNGSGQTGYGGGYKVGDDVTTLVASGYTNDIQVYLTRLELGTV
jgi:hypothetical protein